MSRNIWVVSDWHLGHENIIKYCDRPFKNATEMDEYILEKHNSVVKDGDIVYNLGDVYFSKDKSHNYFGNLISKMRGRKRLILGNHDNGKDQVLQTRFQKIMIWRMFPEFGLLLSHVPVHPGSLVNFEKERALVNVHGHIHTNVIDDARYRNVSVEQINYTPINIEELRVK